MTGQQLTEGTLVANRYRVHERIGAGGMGVVFRASDTRLKRQVALKQLVLRGLDDDEAAEVRYRTLREAEIAARVHHPRIVSIFDVLDDAGGPLLVLEYHPSRSLSAVVADAGVLTPGVAARVGAQIAEALAAADAAGIVHRDVKPGNVLVGPGDPFGSVKLADFGISQISGTGAVTRTGIGTPAFFAPEIARGDAPGPASDVYALGATLRAAVQGAPPYGWSDQDPLRLIARIAREPVPDPTIGGGLGELLGRMTAAEPSVRPSAAQAASELWRLADRTEPLHPANGDVRPPEGTPVPAEPTLGPPTRPWYRRRAVLAAAALVVAAVVGAGVVVAASDGGDPTAVAAPVVAPRFPQDVPPVTIGDPRTADPCSLVRPDALSGFGATTTVPDYDGFAVCLIDVAQRGSDLIEVSTEFRPPSGSPPRGDRQSLGGAQIVRPPRDGDGCQRYLVLDDGTPVDIRTAFYGEGDPVSDLCAVAEAAVASAASTVAGPGIGRRDPPPNGLWAVDACSLLTPEDLSFLPEQQRSDRYRGYAGWQCDWTDGRDPELGITVSFDRYDPPSERGTPVPGTDVFTRADADDRCNGEVAERPFVAVDGRPRAEVLRVLVEGSLPRQQLCDLAGTLAGAAAARVPR